MEKYVTEQIAPTLKIVPAYLLSSFFKKQTSAEVAECLRKTGGFINGVCHPSDNYEQILASGLRWIRVDISFPFDKQGNITESYIDFKKKISGYVEHGIKVMAITPYPYSFMEIDIDPRKPENDKRVGEIAKFLVTDLKGLVNAFQITNEMGIPRFTIPLTMDEAAHFIGVQAKAMQEVKGNVIVGYNSAGPQANLHQKMRKYRDSIDFVGVDIYLGCFYGMAGSMWMFNALLRYLWSYMKKPVLLQEFGYIGDGAPKTPEEKVKILQRYGASSEKEAYEHIEEFVENMPDDMKKYVKHVSSDKAHWGDFIFKSDFVNHLYCELPKKTVLKGYPHTPEGQAKFYTDIYKRFDKLKFMVGAFIYCYSDSEKCYVCSQKDCPTETRWGLVTVDGKEKPSYYAIQKVMKDRN